MVPRYVLLPPDLPRPIGHLATDGESSVDQPVALVNLVVTQHSIESERLPNGITGIGLIVEIRVLPDSVGPIDAAMRREGDVQRSIANATRGRADPIRRATPLPDRQVNNTMRDLADVLALGGSRTTDQGHGYNHDANLHCELLECYAEPRQQIISCAVLMMVRWIDENASSPVASAGKNW